MFLYLHECTKWRQFLENCLLAQCWNESFHFPLIGNNPVGGSSPIYISRIHGPQMLLRNRGFRLLPYKLARMLLEVCSCLGKWLHVRLWRLICHLGTKIWSQCQYLDTKIDDMLGQFNKVASRIKLVDPSSQLKLCHHLLATPAISHPKMWQSLMMICV